MLPCIVEQVVKCNNRCFDLNHLRDTRLKRDTIMSNSVATAALESPCYIQGDTDAELLTPFLFGTRTICLVFVSIERLGDAFQLGTEKGRPPQL